MQSKMVIAVTSDVWSRHLLQGQWSNRADLTRVRGLHCAGLDVMCDPTLTPASDSESPATRPQTSSLSDTVMLHMHLHLTNDKLLLIVVESVLWDLQVERSGTSSNSTRDIVMGTVTRAEPSSVISSLSNRDTTQVGAGRQSCSICAMRRNIPDTQHD